MSTMKLTAPTADSIVLMDDPERPAELCIVVRDQLLCRVVVVASYWGDAPVRPFGAVWGDEIRCRPTLKRIFKARRKLIHRFKRWQAKQRQFAGPTAS